MSFWDNFILGNKDAMKGTTFGSMLGGGQQMAEDTFGGAKVDPNSGRVDTAQSEQDRMQQQDLIQQLQQQMAGKGPSLAQGQLQQATDSNLKQAMALGSAQQGSQGLGYQSALRGIGDQRAGIQQQAVGQSAQIRNMEQMQAQQQLASVLGGMRGQDLGGASDQAHLDLARQQMQQQLDAQGRQNLLSMLSGLGQGAMKFASLGGGGGGSSISMAEGGEVELELEEGDSEANDVVPAMLSPGEIVLPRSIAQAEDAPEKARDFVADLKAKRRAQ